MEWIDYHERAENIKSQCYERLTECIDEETGEVVFVPCGRINKSLLNDKMMELFREVRSEYIDKFVCKTISGLINKNQIYLVRDIVYGDYYGSTALFFILLSVRKDFKYGTMEKTIVFPSKRLDVISRDVLINELKWREPNTYVYTDKYLYILKNEIGRIKIGQAIDVDKRLYALKQAAGMETEVLRKIENAAYLECRLHRHFNHCRYIGEWFNMTNDEIEWVMTIDIVDYFKNSNTSNAKTPKRNTKRILNKIQDKTV